MSLKKIPRDNKKIGSNIKRALKKRNKTQVWLAEQLNIDKTHVNKWVNNHINPNANYLSDIARLLDFDVNELDTGDFKDEMNYQKINKAPANHNIKDEELQLIKIYVEEIIESDSIEEKVKLKTKLLGMISSII
jgi:transcriptional regulator with XRE-family HTH domain